MKSMTALISSLLLGVFLVASLAHAAEEKAPPEGQETFTLYQYQAGSKALAQLHKQIQGDSRFKEQGCEAIGKRAPRYICKKNDAATQALFAAGVSKTVQLNASTAACPTGCSFMRCPPPAGPWKCCSQTTYKPCP